MIQLDIVVAVFRDMEAGQCDVTRFPDLGTQMADGFFHRRGDLRMKLLEEIIARNPQSQVLD